MRIKKAHAGADSNGNVWDVDGAIVDVPDSEGLQLLALPDGDFAHVGDEDDDEVDTAGRMFGTRPEDVQPLAVHPANGQPVVPIVVAHVTEPAPTLAVVGTPPIAVGTPAAVTAPAPAPAVNPVAAAETPSPVLTPPAPSAPDTVRTAPPHPLADDGDPSPADMPARPAEVSEPPPKQTRKPAGRRSEK